MTLGREKVADKILIDRKILEDIHGSIQNAVGSTDYRDIEAKILFLFEAKLAQVLEEEVRLLENVAKGLSKPSPTVVFENDQFIIPKNLKQTIRKVFVHLFRNSMDHGIESSDDRLKTGKPAAGKITITVVEEEQGLLIHYRDDGAGLNLEKIRDLARERGFLDGDSKLEDGNIAELIFSPGFSTAEQVSDISGRGIGMDAVREFVGEVGGNIEIHLDQQGLGTQRTFAFDIRLPYEN